MLRVVYAGTPEFAVPALARLHESAHEVVAVYTQPDRPAGRGRKLSASPVKQYAEKAGIPVEQPLNFKAPADVDRLASYDADVMVVAAYGLILPPAVLDTPRHGCLNIHGSILPRWRGAAPIQRAIQAGDSTTGITIMQMDVGLDTGDMLARAEVPIDETTNAASLHDELMTLGATLLLDVIEQLASGKLTPEKQDDALATYAHKLGKAEARIDWNRPAVEIDRDIRAFNPWPVCFSELDGQLVRVYSAVPISDHAESLPPGTVLEHDKQGALVQCGEGSLRLQELQFAGKKRQQAGEMRNSRDLSGLRFTEAQ